MKKRKHKYKQFLHVVADVDLTLSFFVKRYLLTQSMTPIHLKTKEFAP
jgi:hypothetical protein